VTRKEALSSILQRAERAGWSGADPYDGLDSAVGGLAIPFGPPARTLVIQSALRLPLVRPLLGPRDSVNPKGLALFLGAVVCGRAALGDERATVLARVLVRELESRAQWIAGGAAWGYPFPWQSRFFFAPAGTPNAVVTSTVGWHLLSASEEFGIPAARWLAEGAARFLVGGLPWTDEASGASSVSYTPLDRTRIVNVSGLVARLLARTGNRVRAERLARYIVASQLENGCWPYAPDRRGRWEDSFHTGFILQSLLDLRRFGVDIPLEALRRGFASYRGFFDADGGARLYATPNSVHDAHSAAQGIVTYATAAEESDGATLAGEDPRAAAERIADWALRALWMTDRGCFAYRVRGSARDTRDFTRWVQAWMALGLATADAMSVARGRLAGAGSQGLGVEVA
jgi:hypothetical protein